MTHKGYYKHYKGGIYNVIEIARHTESEEELVIYKDEFGNVWCRPKKMFEDLFYVNGDYRKRFEPLMVAVVRLNDGTYERSFDMTRNIIMDNTTSDIRLAKMYNPLNKYEMLKLKLEIGKHKLRNRDIIIIPMTVMYDGFEFNEVEMNKKLKEEMEEVEKLCSMYLKAMS